MLAAGGCGGFSRAGQSFWRQATVGGPRVVEVLEHYRQASRLTPEQIDEEIGRLRAAWHREQSAETLFQLVALAMQPDRPVVDRRLALNLLTEYQQRAGERDDLLALAGLLADQTRALLRRTDELAEARGRAAGLKEKLRALENIEKILRRREEGLSPGAEEKIRP
jgi:DNA repair exonuclease SbcCD ATPase subunit